MKKSAVIVLLVILILLLGLIIWQNFEKNSKYKGELAEASPRPQNLSVYVLPAIPILTIISPENITYSTSTILLNYSVINEAESIWYNLDNTNNITLSFPIYFSAVEGSHILHLYANNSQGASSKSVTFSVKIETTQPPSGESGGGGGGGGGGSTENKTEQQKENITAEQEAQKNTTEQETPKNVTPISETPRTISEISIKFVISLLFLILLIILIIFLISRIKRKKDKRTRKQNKK
jgi:ATP-dependent Zn protease